MTVESLKSSAEVAVTVMTDSFNGQAIDPGRIRFLTFNTWGLKYIARFRKQRLTALAERLAGNLDAGNFWDQNPNDTKEQYDVVALQEVWCDEDWNYIVERCKHRYPYYRRFKSGMISGPGLAILSKIPIESTFLYRFPINGRPSAFGEVTGTWGNLLVSHF